MPTSIVLVELFLFFGGLLAVGFWQLHSLRKDAQKREPTPPREDPPT